MNLCVEKIEVTCGVIALPFLLLPLLLAMACYSGFPGVFNLRGSSGAATKFRVVALDSVQLRWTTSTARRGN